jgi:hypothetical protein
MDLAFANSLAARTLRLERRFEATEIRIGDYRIILGQNEFSCGPVGIWIKIHLNPDCESA